MKKIEMGFIMAVISAMVLVFFGCSDDNDDASEDNSGNQDASVKEDGGAEGEGEEECVLASPDCAPDPEKRGPFPVGVQTITLTYLARDGNRGVERSIKTEIWYPTTEDAANTMETDLYDLHDDMNEKAKEELAGVEIKPSPHNAYRDAPLNKEFAPYPMLLFSHGNGGIRYQSLFFTNHLASHGYIVIAPDHTGDTLFDLLTSEGSEINEVATSASERPQDINFLQKEFFKKNKDEKDFFYGSINEKEVGISGHSFGGHTAIVVGGRNQYIRASAPMAAPYASYKLYSDIADEFPVPLLIHGATKDDTVSYDQQELAWEKVPAKTKIFASLVDGGHYSYTEICTLDIKEAAAVMGFDLDDLMNDGCGENNVPIEEAHRLINIVTVGFFNYYLRNSKGSAVYFAPDYFKEGDYMQLQRSGEF